MKVFVKRAALFALVLTVWSAGAFAQTTAADGTVKPNTGFDMEGFPLWAKDLRRAEIIAFGTFPFTMFTATFAVDTWRCYNNDWDPKYAPWPFKTAGAITMTNEEHERTMIIAAVASVTLALTDFAIVKIKRYKQSQKASKIPAGSPIIINKAGAEDQTVPSDSPAP